ncbi:MAG TPA: universal stress protein [Aquifex sp.]|nr:universal stress protein [Aquifex sp.]
MTENLLILFKEKIFNEVLSVAKDIATKFQLKVKVYTQDIPQEELEKISQKWDFDVVSSSEDFETILEKERPFLTLLPRPKVSPIVHAFVKPWSEKLVESTDRWNFLLVEQGMEKIKKVLLYVDRDTSSDNYIRSTYEFLKKWGVDFEFVTVFDERYFELLIKKEHPEQEAKELLGRMFEDYISAVREKIKKVLQLEKVEILPLKGEVRKTLPYFAKVHKYDLLVISHAYEDKNELIENSETSVAVFKN